MTNLQNVMTCIRETTDDTWEKYWRRIHQGWIRFFYGDARNKIAGKGNATSPMTYARKWYRATPCTSVSHEDEARKMERQLHSKNASVDAGRRDLHCLDREDRRQISSSRLTYNRQRCLRRRGLLRNGSTKKEHVSVHTRVHVLTQDPNNRTTRMNQFMRWTIHIDEQFMRWTSHTLTVRNKGRKVTVSPIPCPLTVTTNK